MSQSNNSWNTVFELIKSAHELARVTKDRTRTAAKRSYAAYYAWLEDKIRDKAIEILGPGAVTERVLRRQLDFRAKHRNRKLQAVVHNRGRDRLINQMNGADKKEKLAQAGSNTQKGLLEASIRLVADFVRPLVISGQDFRKSKVCKTIKTVSRSTAYKVYDQAVQLVRHALRYSANPTGHQSKQLASCSQAALSQTVTRSKPVAVPPASRIPANRCNPEPSGHLVTRPKHDPNQFRHPVSAENHDPSSNAIPSPRSAVSLTSRPYEHSNSGHTLH